MKENYLSIRNKSIIKANDLIQKTRFSLSLQQQKILLYLIAQIEKEDEEFKEYEFNIRDFCKFCDIDYDNGKNYQNLRDAIQNIRNKSLWVTLPDGTESLLSWIEKARFNKDSGKIKIRLDNDMKPFLLQLRNNFTRYELIFTLAFKSKYSIRLYELVKSIHFHDLEEYERVYTIEELKKLMSAETYKTWQTFKVKALEKAISEINEFSDKTVSYTPMRTGRTFDRIKLTIRTKDPDEVAQIRADIDRRMNFNADQLSLFYEVEQ